MSHKIWIIIVNIAGWLSLTGGCPQVDTCYREGYNTIPSELAVQLPYLVLSSNGTQVVAEFCSHYPSIDNCTSKSLGLCPLLPSSHVFWLNSTDKMYHHLCEDNQGYLEYEKCVNSTKISDLITQCKANIEPIDTATDVHHHPVIRLCSDFDIYIDCVKTIIGGNCEATSVEWIQLFVQDSYPYISCKEKDITPETQPNQICIEANTFLQTELTACQSSIQKSVSKIATDRILDWISAEEYNSKMCRAIEMVLTCRSDSMDHHCGSDAAVYEVQEICHSSQIQKLLSGHKECVLEACITQSSENYDIKEKPNQICLDTNTFLQAEVTACQTSFQSSISKLATDRNHGWITDKVFDDKACSDVNSFLQCKSDNIAHHCGVPAANYGHQITKQSNLIQSLMSQLNTCMIDDYTIIDQPTENQVCLDTNTFLQTELTACQTYFQTTVSKLETHKILQWITEEKYDSTVCGIIGTFLQCNKDRIVFHCGETIAEHEVNIIQDSTQVQELLLQLKNCHPVLPDTNSLAVSCEPITIPTCNNLPYNSTYFPNVLGHKSQTEVDLHLLQLSTILDSQCSPHIACLVCNIFVLDCHSSNFGTNMMPCRKFCQEIKEECSEFNWPSSVDCDSLPTDVCMIPTCTKTYSSVTRGQEIFVERSTGDFGVTSTSRQISVKLDVPYSLPDLVIYLLAAFGAIICIVPIITLKLTRRWCFSNKRHKYQDIPNPAYGVMLDKALVCSEDNPSGDEYYTLDEIMIAPDSDK